MDNVIHVDFGEEAIAPPPPDFEFVGNEYSEYEEPAPLITTLGWFVCAASAIGTYLLLSIVLPA